MGTRLLILAALFAVRIVTGIQGQPRGSLAPRLVNDVYGLSAASSALAGWTRDVTGAPAAPIYFGVDMMFAIVLGLTLFRVLEPRQVVSAHAGVT